VTQLSEYALLAMRAYDRQDDNQAPLPQHWTIYDTSSDDSVDFLAWATHYVDQLDRYHVPRTTPT